MYCHCLIPEKKGQSYQENADRIGKDIFFDGGQKRYRAVTCQRMYLKEKIVHSHRPDVS